MKKTININLGGQPFIIDEPAFDALHNYIEALKLKFTNESERKEIISDIESRTAELFTQRLGKTRAVVAEEDVSYVISLIGRPEDIAGEPEGTAATQDAPTYAPIYTGPVEKKLFRDPDDKKVGGVISGLCHYFGWGDPTWIRVLLVGLIFMSMFAHLGLGVPLVVIYLILLVVVPLANTSTEKLQMQGKPVTLQNIEREVRDAMTTAGHSVNTMMKDNNAIGKVTTASMSLMRVFVKIILILVIFVSAIAMLVLVAVFFGFSILSSASLGDFTHLLVASRGTIMLFNVGLFLTIGIPLVAVMYDSLRYLTGSDARNPLLKKLMWGSWFIGLVFLFFSSWSVLRYFTNSDTANDKVQLVMPKGGAIHVQMADTLGHTFEINGEDNESSFAMSLFNIGPSKTAYGYSLNNIKLEIAVSPDSNFYAERVAFSKGSSIADAAKNNQMIRYRFSQTDSVLNLDDKFEIPKEGKWRGQKVKIRVYVPEGKRITFAENVDQISASVKGNDYFDDGQVSNKTLEVTGGKIKCINCKEKMISDDEDTPETTNAHGHITVSSDSDSSDLKNVSVKVNHNGLTVSGKNDKAENVDVKINKQGISITKTDTLGKSQKVK